jgi:hypothetical protein
VIPPEITECLNKSEWKQIKSLLGKSQPALYYAWGEDYNNNPKSKGRSAGSTEDVRFGMSEELWSEEDIPGCLQL